MKTVQKNLTSVCDKFSAALRGFPGIIFLIQLLINSVINVAGDNSDLNRTVSCVVNRHLSKVFHFGIPNPLWADECNKTNRWRWISAPGRDMCSYSIKWPNASWGVRRNWRLWNVEEYFTPLLLFARAGKQGPTLHPNLNYSEICSVLHESTLKQRLSCAISFFHILTSHSFFIIFIFGVQLFSCQKQGALLERALIQPSSKEKWHTLPKAPFNCFGYDFWYVSLMDFHQPLVSLPDIILGG